MAFIWFSKIFLILISSLLVHLKEKKLDGLILNLNSSQDLVNKIKLISTNLDLDLNQKLNLKNRLKSVQFNKEFRSNTDNLIQHYFNALNGSRSISKYSSKRKAQNYLIKTFRNYSLGVKLNKFSIKETKLLGTNIIAIYPSIKRAQAIKDKIDFQNDDLLVLGAHYDTVIGSPGVIDNGSGIVMLLELARNLFLNKVKLNHTIMFVCFDLEELGLLGSNHFIKKYLIPIEIVKFKTNFLGSYVIDMLLSFSDKPDSQGSVPGLFEVIPEFSKWSDLNQHRGNFAAVVNRINQDEVLFKRLNKNWKKLNESEYKLVPLTVKLPPELDDNYNIYKNYDSLKNYQLFIRSDHASFWFSSTPFANNSLKSVLISDLGLWRENSRKCYHRSCDNINFLTKKNLDFSLYTIKALYKTITESFS